jgi:type IV pilus assembly protein PilB
VKAQAKKQKNTHWMVEIALDLQLPDASQLDLTTDTPAAEAWEQVSRTCSVPVEMLAEHVAAHFDVPVADLTKIEAHVVKLVPEKLAKRLGVMPLREDDRRLVVATADPSNFAAEDDIRFVSGRTPQFEIAAPSAIVDAQGELYSGAREPLALQLEDDLTRVVEVLEESGPEVVDASEVESAPIIKLTNFILSDAVKQRASDIHMEPGRGEGTVRIRVDGVMRTQLNLPMKALNRVITRVKIMGKLDIADRLRPQDGRSRIQIDAKPMELRISTVPTREAEKCVVRLLDHGTAPSLQDLNMPEGERKRINRLLAQRNGIVIVTGPTGSGKTTTLYAAIRELATGEINIMTVENPVEYELPGITQIQVEPKQKVTFPSALRAILRQDPDVILVGEIRDLETAEIALQASMTGHLVLATLHTNDASSAVERLIDLGLDRTAIAASLRGVVAQRLVRRLCDKCAVPATGEPTREEAQLVERFGVKPVRRAVGCPACGQTGYHGRQPVLEVLVSDPRLGAMISTGKTTAELEKAAISGGMTPLLENGLAQVTQGRTTLQEVARVLGGDTAMDGPGGTSEASASTETVGKGVSRILVVDDDKVQRSAARKLLETGGFKVDDAADGATALTKIGGTTRYDLVLLDYTMAEMDGMEVLTQLRTQPSTASLPVIVVTAHEDEALEAKLMNAGADDYIRKPLEPARFTARVKAALRRART